MGSPPDVDLNDYAKEADTKQGDSTGTEDLREDIQETPDQESINE